MSDRPVEPPREIELAEVLSAAEEISDPDVFKILDARIARMKRDHEAKRASQIVQMLDGDGAA